MEGPETTLLLFAEQYVEAEMRQSFYLQAKPALAFYYRIYYIATKTV